jgi:flagellar biosynthetic protein FlhB
MADDAGEKTEQATEKRMKEVREKGQLSRSQDLTAWVGVGAVAVMIPVTIELGTAQTTDQMFTIGSIMENPSLEGAVQALDNGMGSILGVLTPMIVVVTVAVLAAAAIQGGIHFKKFSGKFEQFDLVKGLGRTFGGQALWNGVKAFTKTGVVGLVLFAVIQSLMPVLSTAGGLPLTALISAATGGTSALIQSAVLAGLILAFADVFVVMRRNRKKTRMSKKEIKDESKSSEGDPMIKSQRRARQLAMSRNRMMTAIVDADVVLVNPTHFAIALTYEPGKSAPRVVAKGAGEVAARIRAQAETDGVPIVRDIPLTRALHKACELGQEIPVELYTAVAQVLAFVMALKARGAAQGVHTMSTPTPAPTPLASQLTTGGH